MSAAALPRRLPALDLLRFLAAMAVVVYHYAFRGAAQGKYLPFDFPELAGGAVYGFLGLNVLFMLSGFVILMSVEAAQGRLSRFVASRVARLYPAFLVSAAITLAVVWPLDPPFGLPLVDVPWNLTLAPAWFGARPIDGAYWTLAIELHFYFLVGACLLLPRWLKLDTLLLLWAVALTVAWLSPYYLTALDWLAMRQWGPLFLAGCLLYRLYREGWTLRRGLLLAWTGALCLVALVPQMRTFEAALGTPFPIWPSLALFVALYLAFIAACSRPRWLERGGAVFTLLGGITYPLYLVHQKLGYLLITALAPITGRGVALVAAIVFALVLAWLINRYIELPWNRPLRRLLERHLRPLDGRRLPAPGDVAKP